MVECVVAINLLCFVLTTLIVYNYFYEFFHQSVHHILHHHHRHHQDIHDVEKSVPYLQAHPDLEITVEVYLECPEECNSQRCGHCTKEQCNNTRIAEEQVCYTHSF